MSPRSPRSGDQPIIKHKLPGGKEDSLTTGLAAFDGIVACSLPKQKQLVFIDAHTGKEIGATPCDDPRGLAFDGSGQLLVLAGKSLLRYPRTDFKQGVRLPDPDTLIADKLDDPQQIAFDSQANIYISDRGKSHQVKVFSKAGRPLGAIGAQACRKPVRTIPIT